MILDWREVSLRHFSISYSSLRYPGNVCNSPYTAVRTVLVLRFVLWLLKLLAVESNLKSVVLHSVLLNPVVAVVESISD